MYFKMSSAICFNLDQSKKKTLKLDKLERERENERAHTKHVLDG